MFALFAGPAQFKTCAGRKIPKVGCSDVEHMFATTSDISVDFDVSLTHENDRNNCFLQHIAILEFYKDGKTTVLCGGLSRDEIVCKEVDRINVTSMRTDNRSVDLSVSLLNPTPEDTGLYAFKVLVEVAGENARYPLYKNFTLNVIGKLNCYSKSFSCKVSSGMAI